MPIQVSSRTPGPFTKLLNLSRNLTANSVPKAIIRYAFVCTPIRRPERDDHPQISNILKMIPDNPPVGPVAVEEFSHVLREASFPNGRDLYLQPSLSIVECAGVTADRALPMLWQSLLTFCRAKANMKSASHGVTRIIFVVAQVNYQLGILARVRVQWFFRRRLISP